MTTNQRNSALAVGQFHRSRRNPRRTVCIFSLGPCHALVWTYRDGKHVGRTRISRDVLARDYRRVEGDGE